MILIERSVSNKPYPGCAMPRAPVCLAQYPSSASHFRRVSSSSWNRSMGSGGVVSSLTRSFSRPDKTLPKRTVRRDWSQKKLPLKWVCEPSAGVILPVTGAASDGPRAIIEIGPALLGRYAFGIGHTAAAGSPDPARMPRGMPGDVDAGIREAFRTDLASYGAEVLRTVKVPLEPPKFDALVSFHYNTAAISTAALDPAHSPAFPAVPARVGSGSPSAASFCVRYSSASVGPSKDGSGRDRPATIRPNSPRMSPWFFSR
ncbi:glycoside hydrolase family protein [Pseudogemmobacter faecipullorum]|uniref:glycoside hydrolase family protein n=1 Tax=Pseudogemmobacter faecipullorum TaxID=2755041 RepID=UPI003F49AE71